MKHAASVERSHLARIAALSVGLFVLAAILAPALRADPKSDSQKQFERAAKMRTMLEGFLEKDRSLGDYQQTVLAYRKVYLITPEAPDATTALIAEAELYEEMGRIFDPKFFGDAVARRNFLLKQYPGTRYRAETLFTIGKIQKDDQKKSADAQATFKEFLKRYPRSEKADAARLALRELAGQRPADAQPQPALRPPGQREADQHEAGQRPSDSVQTPQQPVSPDKAPDKTDEASASHPNSKQQQNSPRAQNVSPQNVSDAHPELKGQAVEPRVSDLRISSVTKVETWNSPDSTRIVVSLNDTIKYEAARIQSPDRIYFNLYKAKVSGKLARKALDVDDGTLKTIRVAQNKPDVVRIVLDVDGDRDYSAFLLANPYRLVIDIHGRFAKTANTSAASNPPVALVPTPATTVQPSAAPSAPATAASVLAPTAETPSATLEPQNAATKPDVKAPAAVRGPIAAAPPAPQSPAKVAEKTVLPLSKNAAKRTALIEPPPEPKPTRDGQRSLSRALGLKISRIVIDAGHGGHDTGTIGPHGLMEKDLCLDVALRLGSLIEEKLPGAEVVYTRMDDTFIPLEERTAIANQAQADLFISIHANSSRDGSARGIETYYLNFATTEESMEVASRENALSQESQHDLQDLIKKIARNDKVEESKELASDIQDSLTQRLQLVTHNEKNRGVKKAPFIVLIGANMPSILSEISFVSNPTDERLLRKNDQRQRIADGLYRGISSYLDSLNSLSNNKQKLVSDNPAEPGTLASNGNPK
jgi:N-acetylmuramoyl-L-alanine amidase